MMSPCRPLIPSEIYLRMYVCPSFVYMTAVVLLLLFPLILNAPLIIPCPLSPLFRGGDKNASMFRE